MLPETFPSSQQATTIYGSQWDIQKSQQRVTHITCQSSYQSLKRLALVEATLFSTHNISILYSRHLYVLSTEMPLVCLQILHNSLENSLSEYIMLDFVRFDIKRGVPTPFDTG